MSTQTVKIIIHGTVQGVFFRASAKEKAGELKIHGYIKNRKDGAVEAIASGEEENLKQFIQWCHEGPTNASVTSVEVKELPPAFYNSFKITHE